MTDRMNRFGQYLWCDCWLPAWREVTDLVTHPLTTFRRFRRNVRAFVDQWLDYVEAGLRR